MKKIPPLYQKPDEEWWYNRRYFDVGEVITYMDHRSDKPITTIVKKISVNNFGRVSYEGENKELIFTEDIVRGMPGAKIMGLNNNG